MAADNRLKRAYRMDITHAHLKASLRPWLRQALGLTLSVSFALSPISASAQSLGALGTRVDPASLIIRSMSAKNAEEARGYLEKAIALLPAENLSPADEQSLRDMISQSIQSIPSRFSPVARGTYSDTAPNMPGAPTTYADTSPPASPQSAQGDAADKLQRQFKAAPELQNTTRRLGELRLMRDSVNVDQNVTTLVGTSPQQIDQKEENAVQEANQPGELLGYLKSKGLIQTNFTADNKDLLEKYQGEPLASIAHRLIVRSSDHAAIAAASRKLVAVVGGNMIKGGLVQTFGAIAGLSVEAAATFIINANLTLQIADLYNIRLSNYEQEVAVLAVFAGAKATVAIGARSAKLQDLLSGVARNFADAKMRVPGNSGFKFLKTLLGMRVVTRGLQADGVAIPGQATTPAAPTAPTGPANTTPATTPSTATAATPEAGKSEPVKKAGFFATAWSKIFSVTKAVIPIGLAGAWANLETRTIGYVAVKMFGQMRQRERETQNNNFRRFMMSPAGDGFLKLMILSINVGKPMDTPDDSDHPQDPRAQYVLNLARSARICSPLDRQQWLLAKAGQMNSASEMTQRILKYDCDNNLNTSRYVRVKTEFESFNEIPQDFITYLRAAGRENRLRMGEILLQMQFLDGDRSPTEVLYFNSVISKYLGFTTNEELDYFNRLHSFIVENGGMAVAETSPTGFTIGNNVSSNPYDLNLGYLNVRSPEAPSIATNSTSNGFQPNNSNQQNGSPQSSPNNNGTRPGGFVPPTLNQNQNQNQNQNPQSPGAPNNGVSPNAPQRQPLGGAAPDNTQPTITIPFNIPAGTVFTPTNSGNSVNQGRTPNG